MLIVITGSFCYLFYETYIVKTNYVDFKTKKLPIGSTLKILQFTDYHNANLNKTIIARIKAENPDIIAITGDLIDKKTKDYKNVFSLAEEISKLNPNVYYVSGNHEWKNGHNSDFIKGLQSHGIKVINNTRYNLKLRDKEIYLCGIDFYPVYSNMEKVIDNLDSTKYAILLSHNPQVIEGNFFEGIDLVLSGHTHGGQIRLPFIGSIIAPEQGIFPHFDKGVFKVKNTRLYIDSGVGTTRLPIRTFNRSQISVITIMGEE